MFIKLHRKGYEGIKNFFPCFIRCSNENENYIFKYLIKFHYFNLSEYFYQILSIIVSKYIDLINN